MMMTRVGIIDSRKDLIEKGLLKENVFNNCASFIKINESINLLTVQAKSFPKY